MEQNDFFWLFLFSGILGQLQKAHPKFQNEIMENLLSTRPPPGISGMESAPEFYF